MFVHYGVRQGSYQTWSAHAPRPLKHGTSHLKLAPCLGPMVPLVVVPGSLLTQPAQVAACLSQEHSCWGLGSRQGSSSLWLASYLGIQPSSA